MENRNIKVSIIVPVYNGEVTISRCVDSILKQTLAEFELIIIDDGSVDRTGEICKAIEDERLVYYRQENKGVSAARNAGIKLARGEYIGFVDADDYITSDMCEKIYFACKEAHADIGICDYDIVFDDGRRERYTDLLRGGAFDRQQIFDEVLSKFLGHTDAGGNIAKYDWLVMRRLFKREFLLQNGLLFDETLSNSEDCLFSYLSANCAKCMVYLKGQSFYTQVRNAASLTRRYLPDYWQQRCRVMDSLECIAADKDSFALFVMRCVRPSFTNIAYGFGKVGAVKSIKAFREIVFDVRVRKMCDTLKTDGLNDEWTKLFNWCKRRKYFTLYFYYMDVQHHNKLCRFIRRVQKYIVRKVR